jgi:hypothetical protein
MHSCEPKSILVGSPSFFLFFMTMALDLNPAHYSAFGLSHDLRYLESLKPDVVWYKIGEQSKCADAITKRYHDNMDFVLSQQMLNDKDQWKQTVTKGTWNATSVGNLAYCALHAPNNEIREIAVGDYNFAMDLLRKQYPVSLEKKNELEAQTIENHSNSNNCVVL